MRVYRLVAIEVAGDRRADASCSTYEPALGVFTSPQNAEAMIRIHADKSENVLGYALYENELDDISLRGPWNGIPEFLSVRTYFADGTLNAFCDCDDTCEKQWHGRDPKTIHYKRGDFVSVWHGGKIVPALVGELPIDMHKRITGDWSDDCYLAYFMNGGHEHPFTPYVFPLVGKLSKKVRAKLEAVRDEEESERRGRRCGNEGAVARQAFCERAAS